MEINNQLDGTTWVEQDNIQIEIFDGGANKYVDEELTTRYECSEISEIVIDLCSNINEVDNMCHNLCNIFGGEIFDETVPTTTVYQFEQLTGLVRGASKRTIDNEIKALRITNENLIADIYGSFGI